MRVNLWLGSDKGSSWNRGEELGFSGEALVRFKFLGYEHKMTYEVDENGEGVLVAVDDRELKE
jgi:hypothetical protein